MEELLPNGNGQAIRQRKRGGVREVVQEFDGFLKVSDDVKEEPKTVNGICMIGIVFNFIIFSFKCQLFAFHSLPFFLLANCTTMQLTRKWNINFRWTLILKSDFFKIIYKFRFFKPLVIPHWI